MSMNAKEIDSLMRSIAPVLADTFPFKDAVSERIKELEDRIKELEARPAMDYRGVWKQGAVYNKGCFCTHQGSLWHCNEANAARPGDGSKSWTLAVKRGKVQDDDEHV